MARNTSRRESTRRSRVFARRSGCRLLLPAGTAHRDPWRASLGCCPSSPTPRHDAQHTGQPMERYPPPPPQKSHQPTEPGWGVLPHAELPGLPQVSPASISTGMFPRGVAPAHVGWGLQINPYVFKPGWSLCIVTFGGGFIHS